MWFGDSSTLLSFPLASRMMDELTNSPKIQVRLAEYWVVFPPRTTEEECATKDKFGRIFSLWVFVWMNQGVSFFFPQESPWKIWCYAKSCWDSFQVLWWWIFQPKKPARVSRKFPCHCHLAIQIEIGLNNNHYSSSLNNPGSKAVELG